MCVADELAGAAELVMGKDRGIRTPCSRGVDSQWLRPGSVASEIVRPPARTCSAGPRRWPAARAAAGAGRVSPRS